MLIGIAVVGAELLVSRECLRRRSLPSRRTGPGIAGGFATLIALFLDLRCRPWGQRGLIESVQGRFDRVNQREGTVQDRSDRAFDSRSIKCALTGRKSRIVGAVFEHSYRASRQCKGSSYVSR